MELPEYTLEEAQKCPKLTERAPILVSGAFVYKGNAELTAHEFRHALFELKRPVMIEESSYETFHRQNKCDGTVVASFLLPKVPQWWTGNMSFVIEDIRLENADKVREVRFHIGARQCITTSRVCGEGNASTRNDSRDETLHLVPQSSPEGPAYLPAGHLQLQECRVDAYTSYTSRQDLLLSGLKLSWDVVYFFDESGATSAAITKGPTYVPHYDLLIDHGVDRRKRGMTCCKEDEEIARDV